MPHTSHHLFNNLIVVKFFLKKIVPNDKLILKTEIMKFQRGLAICKGQGYVENKLACSAEFSLILPDEIKKYKIVT